MKTETFRKAVAYCALVVATFIILFPVFWMISISIRPEQEIFGRLAVFFTSRPTLEHYFKVMDPTFSDFGRYLINSIIVASSVAFVAVAISVLAGYSLSRFRFAGKGTAIGLILGQQVFPSVLLLIPIFMMLRTLQLVDTYPGLILTHTTFALPFTVLMLRGYFATIPKDLEEAAMVDGCSRIGAIAKVIMPIAAPGISAAVIFAFMVSWHEYMFALTLMMSSEMRTLPPGIALFQETHRIMWGETMAGSVITVVPVVVFFMFLQKYMIAGLTAGAVKA